MENRYVKSMAFLFSSILLILIYEQIPIKVPCLFELVTGYYCPGCGVTRVLFALLHGDIKQAFAYNYLVMILLPLFFILSGHRYYCWLKHQKDLWTKAIPEWFWYSLIGIAIVFAILRNIPDFWYFAPHAI